MKTISLLILLLASVSAGAQTSLSVAEEIIEEMQAVIEQKEQTPTYVIMYVYPPEWYNLELVVAQVKRIADKYPDVKFLSQWERNEKTNDYACLLSVNGKILSVKYQPENIEVLFYCAL